MGKTWKRDRTPQHKREIILKRTKNKKIHKNEDYLDDTTIQPLRPEETSDFGYQTPEDRETGPR